MRIAVSVVRLMTAPGQLYTLSDAERILHKKLRGIIESNKTCQERGGGGGGGGGGVLASATLTRLVSINQDLFRCKAKSSLLKQAKYLNVEKNTLSNQRGTSEFRRGGGISPSILDMQNADSVRDSFVV
ncbi:hypothetical protein FGIG_10115 [Fasciola gigantica]|uniref:Uncharacterized protein n=1 Tax=Fasciola gigantica TaxID=46835 RepID=A0A504YW50_FASGI|nr:hypothetical protein FGIG_10115 [Fasciola gigantica]